MQSVIEDVEQLTDPTEYDQTKNVYVKYLNKTITDDMLKAAFENFGSITSCVVQKNEDGTSRGFGFIAFETSEQAQNAIRIMNGAFVMGGKIKACQAQKKENRAAMLNAVMNRETTLYVKYLHEDVHDEELRKFFSRFGEIVEARVAMSQDGSSKRLALITFKAYADARKAVNASVDGIIADNPSRIGDYSTTIAHTAVEEEGAVVH
uniref:RRM domain-containing protein n=1 Tax=Steinernema glaseri TaxID=37863 RepID=A0A1I7YX33_9BILA